MILAYVVAAEAALAVVLTLPSPKAVKSRIVSVVSLILQPSLFVIPFAGFQLLGARLFSDFWFLNILCRLILIVCVILNFVFVSVGG